MASQIWLERAEVLHSELARINSMLIDGVVDSPDDRRKLEVVAIARWLRCEFSDEAPEDTHTLALFPDSPRG